MVRSHDPLFTRRRYPAAFLHISPPSSPPFVFNHHAPLHSLSTPQYRRPASMPLTVAWRAAPTCIVARRGSKESIRLRSWTTTVAQILPRYRLRIAFNQTLTYIVSVCSHWETPAGIIPMYCQQSYERLWLHQSSRFKTNALRSEHNMIDVTQVQYNIHLLLLENAFSVLQ